MRTMGGRQNTKEGNVDTGTYENDGLLLVRRMAVCDQVEREHWRWVVGWELLYMVSTFGRVISTHRIWQTTFGERLYGGGLVNQFPCSNGYVAVNLTAPGRGRAQRHVHRLVLEAWIGPPPAGMQACHWDGDRSNARLENLRWDTVANNHQDKKRHGTWQAGNNHWKRKPREARAPGATLERLEP